MEEFKEILNYEDYEISNFGRIRTKARLIRYIHSVTKQVHYRMSNERFMKVYENKLTGYKHVILRKNNTAKTETIHKLVATTFLKKEFESYNTINHIDGNKHNNCLTNLEWCTNSYNHEHAIKNGLKAKGESIGTSKLNNRCVNAIRYFLLYGVSKSKIAEAFDVSRATIILIEKGKIWKHVALTGEELTIKDKTHEK